MLTSELRKGPVRVAAAVVSMTDGTGSVGLPTALGIALSLERRPQGLRQIVSRQMLFRRFNDPRKPKTPEQSAKDDQKEKFQTATSRPCQETGSNRPLPR